MKNMWLRRWVRLSLAALVGVCAAGIGLGQAAKPSTPMPQIVQKDGRWALLVDGAPYLMLGVQVNNSSAWPGILPEVWPAVERLHANTVEAPVYWEQMEAVPGKFDFTVVDALLAGAREHKVRLVLLWFGTWKNGNPHYVPEWVKRNSAKYPRLVDAKGTTRDTMSPFSAAMLEADSAAFRALMRHLKATDARHTVIMIQVENEINAYGSARDFSPEAVKAFAGPVPAGLLSTTKKNAGTWEQVFGPEASDTFQTWSIARFVEQVAKAGKQEYPLPMYLNHSLSDPLRTPADNRLAWPAMTDHVLDIWKSTAPSLNVIAPDIYISDYAKYERVLDSYARKDNAMFVPETGNAAAYPRYLFAALGHGAIGWSPFGLDYTGYANAPLGAPVVDEKLVDLFAADYKLIGPMQREIALLEFAGKVQGVAEDPAVHATTLEFGTWTATVAYGLRVFGRSAAPPGNAEPVGRALVAQLGPDEFLVTGLSARVDFHPTDATDGRRRELLRVEEGTYVNGKWKFLRLWNGDQTDYGLNFTTQPQVLRVTLMAVGDRNSPE